MAAVSGTYDGRVEIAGATLPDKRVPSCDFDALPKTYMRTAHDESIDSLDGVEVEANT
jgi:hypothetical protein